jgi:hypothetical protein
MPANTKTPVKKIPGMTAEERTERAGFMRREAAILIGQAFMAAKLFCENADRIHPEGAGFNPCEENMSIVAETINKLNSTIVDLRASVKTVNDDSSAKIAAAQKAQADAEAKVVSLTQTLEPLQKQVLDLSDKSKNGVLDDADLVSLQSAAQLLGM